MWVLLVQSGLGREGMCVRGVGEGGKGSMTEIYAISERFSHFD